MKFGKLKSLRHAVHGIALKCISFAALAATASAGPITIDDFSTPNSEDAYVIALINGNPYTKSYSGPGILNNAPTVPLGERQLYVHVVTNPVGKVDAAGTIGNGSFDFTSAVKAGVEASLTYSAPGGGPLGGADVTGGGTNNAFDLDLTSDFTFNIQIDAIGPSGSVSAVYSHIGGSSTDNVPFSSFSPVAGTFNFNNVDKLVFSFNPGGSPKALDFNLVNIRAIPEPATAILALLGSVLAIGAVRWQRNLLRR